jgi:predicted DNA binding protein
MAEHATPVRPPAPEAPSTAIPSSTARFALPAEEFALADLFERVPDARVKCDSAVANPDDHALLVVRTDERKRAVDAALRADPGVAAVECFGERPDGWRYRVTWKGRPQRLIKHLVAADSTLLSARGQGVRWEFRLLAPDREGVSRAYDIMQEFGCDAECLSISTIDGTHSHHSGLTDDQREALVEAFELGYHDIPREATAEELADELGISHQAVSERLWRGYSQLIEAELVVSNEEPL